MRDHCHMGARLTLRRLLNLVTQELAEMMSVGLFDFNREPRGIANAKRGGILRRPAGGLPANALGRAAAAGGGGTEGGVDDVAEETANAVKRKAKQGRR
jgi:hypothetical protein